MFSQQNIHIVTGGVSLSSFQVRQHIKFSWERRFVSQRPFITFGKKSQPFTCMHCCMEVIWHDFTYIWSRRWAVVWQDIFTYIWSRRWAVVSQVPILTRCMLLVSIYERVSPNRIASGEKTYTIEQFECQCLKASILHNNKHPIYNKHPMYKITNINGITSRIPAHLSTS